MLGQYWSSSRTGTKQQYTILGRRFNAVKSPTDLPDIQLGVGRYANSVLAQVDTPVPSLMGLSSAGAVHSTQFKDRVPD